MKAASNYLATALACVAAAGVVSCSSDGRGHETTSGGQAGAGAPTTASGMSGGGTSAGTDGGRGGSESGAGMGPAGGVATGGEAGSARPDPTSLIPARVRRLASAEYDASVRALLATAQTPASGPDFPPDLRQDGFTVNDEQRIDALIVERLADAADSLANEAEQNGTLARLAPCPAGDEPASCAERFVRSFGAKVYRRPLSNEEVAALLALYAVGAEGTTYDEGVTHVTRGLLQSAGFLYLTELGDGVPSSDGTALLTDHEIAAALSYFLTSAPPDDELLEQALVGALRDPAEREAQARRLLENDPLARDTAVRVVREWLGIDRIEESSKDSLVYPLFASEKSRIVAESRDFVRAVAFESTGTVGELFGATWTVNTGPLALYQTDGDGPIPGSSTLSDRIGILNQAAFLATYANAHESHPIFRGVALAMRVVCLGLDSPASFNIEVVPPAPDPTKTTRERFSVHPVDSICAGCHRIIDPFGFSFEHFDGMGAYRAAENGQAVDSSVVVDVPAEYDGPYADSNALALALAQSEAVRECMARYLYRAAAGTGDSAATPGEPQFLEVWRTIPAAAQGNIVETLIAYVKNPSFDVRLVP